MKISRVEAVSLWLTRAVSQFYLGFIIPEKISSYYKNYRNFFYANGLEMLCKAYIIGSRYSEYKNLSYTKAKEKIEYIARNFGHNLNRLIQELINIKVLPTGFLNEVHHRSNINNVDFTNLDIIKTLKALYFEARYPVIELDYKRYYREKVKKVPSAINKRLIEIPSASHQMERFILKMFKLLITKVENDFRLKISREKLRGDITDRDWNRFSNLFLEN